MTDLAGAHAAQNADQESPIDVRLHEVGARPPNIHPALAAGEQRLLQKSEQLLIVKSVARKGRQIFWIDELEGVTGALVVLLLDGPVDELVGDCPSTCS
jgi:hypothetical protein